MVMDQFDPIFPHYPPVVPSPYVPPAKTFTVTNPPPFEWPTALMPAKDLEDLRALIREFREMVAAAKRVDALAKQPDCTDPEKAKLEERVAKLEAAIAGLSTARRDKPARRQAKR